MGDFFISCAVDKPFLAPASKEYLATKPRHCQCDILAQAEGTISLLGLILIKENTQVTVPPLPASPDPGSPGNPNPLEAEKSEGKVRSQICSSGTSDVQRHSLSSWQYQ